MDKFLGLKIEYVLIFVILGLLYFTLGKCNCDRFSVGGKNQDCDDKIAACKVSKRCLNVDFSGCDLSTVNSTNWQMNAANLKGTTLSHFLEGTNLWGATWDEYTNWDTTFLGKTECDEITNLPLDIDVGDYKKSVSCSKDGYIVVTKTKKPKPNNKCSKGTPPTVCEKGKKCCYHAFADDSCCTQDQECGEFYGCNDAT